MIKKIIFFTLIVTVFILLINIGKPISNEAVFRHENTISAKINEEKSDFQNKKTTQKIKEKTYDNINTNEDTIINDSEVKEEKNSSIDINNLNSQIIVQETYNIDVEKIYEKNNIPMSYNSNMKDIIIENTIEYIEEDESNGIEQGYFEYYEIINSADLDYSNNVLELAINAVEAEPKVDLIDAGYSYSKPSTACKYIYQHSTGKLTNKPATVGNVASKILDGASTYYYKIDKVKLGASLSALKYSFQIYSDRHTYVTAYYYKAEKNKYCNTKGMEKRYYYHKNHNLTSTGTYYYFK